MKNIFWAGFLILFMLSCRSGFEKKVGIDYQTAFADVLNIKAIPSSPDNLDAFGFSDMGAWHAYSLPNRDSVKYFGGFCGPLLMKMSGQWIGKSLCRLTLIDETGQPILYDPDKVKLTYLPGKLIQELNTGNFKVKLSLIFTDNRTALISSEIENNSNQQKRIHLLLHGDVWLENLKVTHSENSIKINLPDSSFVSMRFPAAPVGIDYNGKDINIDLGQITLAPGKKYKTAFCQSYFFTDEEATEHEKLTDSYVQEPELYFRRNTERWNAYLQSVVSEKDSVVKQNLAVKCVETLLSNWRSPAGALKHNGVFPSSAYQGFYGFWAWDSWKHAAALASFAPELAKESMRSMFDFQNEAGMVADCIYFDSTENNWRDTKAPLAAWAVCKIWEATVDTAFVREMYPRLVKYHYWWYTNRDSNKNGLCEYGSTDGSLIAAKWESGMDNAVRFDNSQIRKITETAWALNQESVDLNAYLQKEKVDLAKLALVLGKKKDAAVFTEEANRLAQEIKNHFWSEKYGYFFDRNTDDNSFIETFGTEGWTLLWTGVASKTQADQVVKIMLDPKRFNTSVPFPTLDASNPKFDPLDGYWRGPVWIDQACFGIEALENYGYLMESELLKRKLLEHASGLLSDGAIRENYHPLTGEGLNATHFSWSAAHLLLLLLKK